MRGITAGLLVGLLLPLSAGALSNRTPLTDTELETIAVQPEEAGPSTVSEAVRRLVERELPQCLVDSECRYQPTSSGVVRDSGPFMSMSLPTVIMCSMAFTLLAYLFPPPQ